MLEITQMDRDAKILFEWLGRKLLLVIKSFRQI